VIVQFGLDDDFVRPGGVAIASVDRFLGPSDRILVLHTGITAESQAMLDQCVRQAELEFIDCTGRLDAAWIPPSYVTSATYLRFLAAELLPDESRCLYLDGDVLVRRDIAPLFEVDIDDHVLAAVQSRVAPFVASPGGVANWFELGLRSTNPYFNAGVLLMNLERWRNEGVTARLTGFLRQYGNTIRFGDQEAMNAVLSERWVSVDRGWNYITHVTESFLQQPDLEPADPSIVHFAGRIKPWSYGAKPIFAEEWYKILKNTPWSSWRPSPVPPDRSIRARARRAVRAGFARVRDTIGE
jgi:lipopolysaccharide biosynthesis glycosyltransferase